MDPHERRFAVLISSSHGLQHFLRRIFPPLIPIWAAMFGFPLTSAGILLGVQALGSALGQAPFGILSDRYDRRYILPSGIAVSAVCVGAFATVPFLGVVEADTTVLGVGLNLPYVSMLVAMFGVGLGGSVLHPTGYPLISENVAPGRKGRVLGMWGSAAKLGDGFAPAVVGVFLLAIAWTDILLLASLVITGYSVFLFVALGRFETRPAAGAEADRRPSSALDDASTSGPGSSLLAGDRRLYLYPVVLIFLFFAARMLAVSGVNVFIPEFITSEYGYSFAVAGIELTPESTASFYYSALLITAGVVQILVGRLVDVYDTRKVIIGMLLVAVLVLSSLAVFTFSPVVLFVVLLLLGASLWAVQPARDALISDISPDSREGRTFGYLWTGALLVSALSPVLIGYIGEHAGLRFAFGLLAATTVLSTVPIALLFTTRLYLRGRTPSPTSVRNDD